MIRRQAALMFCGLLLPTSVLAWGSTGHKVVGLIAQSRLTPAARVEVERILGKGQDLAQVSTWADNLRHVVPEERWKVMGRWHYINLDIRDQATLFGWETACPKGDCVIAQVERDLEVLRSPFADKSKKKNALRFLVHFIGDLHQPLHCADDGDEGGNDKWFLLRPASGGRSQWVNLHALWDNLLRVGPPEDPKGLARRLLHGLDPAAAKGWEKGSARDWAFESYALARSILYQDLPRGPLNLPPEDPRSQGVRDGHWGKGLPPGYGSGKMRDLAEERLQKAGVRLAWLLNGIFKE